MLTEVSRVDWILGCKPAEPQSVGFGSDGLVLPVINHATPNPLLTFHRLDIKCHFEYGNLSNPLCLPNTTNSGSVVSSSFTSAAVEDERNYFWPPPVFIVPFELWQKNSNAFKKSVHVPTSRLANLAIKIAGDRLIQPKRFAMCFYQLPVRIWDVRLVDYQKHKNTDNDGHLFETQHLHDYINRQIRVLHESADDPLHEIGFLEDLDKLIQWADFKAESTTDQKKKKKSGFSFAMYGVPLKDLINLGIISDCIDKTMIFHDAGGPHAFMRLLIKQLHLPNLMTRQNRTRRRVQKLEYKDCVTSELLWTIFFPLMRTSDRKQKVTLSVMNIATPKKMIKVNLRDLLAVMDMKPNIKYKDRLETRDEVVVEIQKIIKKKKKKQKKNYIKINESILTNLRHHLIQIDLSEYSTSQQNYRGDRWKQRIMPIFMLPFVFQQTVINGRLDLTQAQQICCEILISLIAIKDSSATASDHTTKTDKEREVALFSTTLLCCTIGMVWPQLRDYTLKLSESTLTVIPTTTINIEKKSKRKASDLRLLVLKQKKKTNHQTAATGPVVVVSSTTRRKRKKRK